MSAFIVSNNCINDVITLIKNIVDLKDKYNDCGELGKDLFNMNVEAYDQRYAEDNKKLTSFEYVKSERDDIVQYYSLCCLEYQCSEGDVPETDFYKFIFQHCKDQIEDYLYKKYIGGSDSKDKYRKIIWNYIKEKKLKTYWGE